MYTMESKRKTATKEVKVWTRLTKNFKKRVERKNGKAEIKTEKGNENYTKISSGKRNEYMD